jgi:hypothetical protein
MRSAGQIAFAAASGWLLGHAARWFADGMAVNAQLYFHAFRFDNISSPWVYAPLRFLSAAVLQYSGLASWAFACGFVCARTSARSARWCLGVFALAALLGRVFTTTSVRLAQPRFFQGAIPATVYPMALTVLLVVIPAAVAVRAAYVRPAVSARASTRHRLRRSTVTVAIGLVAVIGIGLTWWNAADLGNALTFGCIVRTGTGTAYCTPREMPVGVGCAVVLTAIYAWMTWDAGLNRES